MSWESRNAEAAPAPPGQSGTRANPQSGQPATRSTCPPVNPRPGQPATRSTRVTALAVVPSAGGRHRDSIAR
jgi:hypothetical protein